MPSRRKVTVKPGRTKTVRSPPGRRQDPRQERRGQGRREDHAAEEIGARLRSGPWGSGAGRIPVRSREPKWQGREGFRPFLSRRFSDRSNHHDERSIPRARAGSRDLFTGIC